MPDIELALGVCLLNKLIKKYLWTIIRKKPELLTRRIAAASKNQLRQGLKFKFVYYLFMELFMGE